MKETGSPKLLFEMLDLTPILWRDLHREGPGRPVKYSPEWDLRALMLRQLEHIPYIKDLVKRLLRNYKFGPATFYWTRFNKDLLGTFDGWINDLRHSCCNTFYVYPKISCDRAHRRRRQRIRYQQSRS